MRGINASATLYNYYKNPETGKEEWRPVCLESVHWESREGANAITSGLKDADGLLVMIWLDVRAQGRTYLPPKAFASLSAADADKHWTLTKGKDRIVKGAIEDAVATERISDIANSHDDCYTVTNADMVDYGPRSEWHLEVAGK